MKYSYYEENPDEVFVEWDDVWTRKDVQTFTDDKTPSNEYFNLLKRKVVSLRLPLANGEVVEEINSEKDLDEVDIRIWQWFALTPLKHISRLRELGEAKGLSLFTTSAAAKEQMESLAKATQKN